MSISPIVSDLAAISIPLTNLYLDPNNPRFAGSDSSHVPDVEIDDPARQQAVRARLISDFSVDRLRRNIEVNGFLPVDRPIVRQFKENKFVVLEGNRRVCAAQLISHYAEQGEKVADEVITSLKVIQCLQYTGDDPDAAWIFQGIRHISGIVDWSSFNKARLLVEQMDREQLTLTDIGRRFGISAQGAGQWLRGYKAFQQAVDHPDYSDYVDEKAYPFFMELFSRTSTPIREWLAWDDAPDYQFRNELNFSEFLGWLYPEESEDQVVEGRERKKDWSNRVLSKRDDVRNIAYLIQYSPEFFQRFRRDHDLERAYAEARAKELEDKIKESRQPVDEALKAVETCSNAINAIPYRAMREEATRTRIVVALQHLKKTIEEFTVE